MVSGTWFNIETAIWISRMLVMECNTGSHFRRWWCLWTFFLKSDVRLSDSMSQHFKRLQRLYSSWNKPRKLRQVNSRSPKISAKTNFGVRASNTNPVHGKKWFFDDNFQPKESLCIPQITSLSSRKSSRGWASSTRTSTSSPICDPTDTDKEAWTPTCKNWILIQNNYSI